MALGIAFGTLDDALKFQTVKKYIAEFISTLLFVYAGVGSAIAFNKLTSDASLTPAGLVAVAVAHALALFVTVSIAANISGGHVNPAVTFGLTLGGHITVLRGVFYWIASGLHRGMPPLEADNWRLVDSDAQRGVGVSLGEGVVMEMVITFGLVYTVYATAADPKKGDVGIVAPIAIGFIVGANILAAEPFSGGSMNPARSFGPALVSFDWKDQWVYWVGPLVGGGLAGIVYGGVFIDNPAHVPLATSDF